MATPSIRKKKRTVNSLIDYWESPTVPLPEPLFTPNRKSIIAFEKEMALLKEMNDYGKIDLPKRKKKNKGSEKKSKANSIAERQRNRQRNEAAREILLTEESYVKGLEIFVNV